MGPGATGRQDKPCTWTASFLRKEVQSGRGLVRSHTAGDISGHPSGALSEKGQRSQPSTVLPCKLPSGPTAPLPRVTQVLPNMAFSFGAISQPSTIPSMQNFSSSTQGCPVTSLSRRKLSLRVGGLWGHVGPLTASSQGELTQKWAGWEEARCIGSLGKQQ